MLRWFPLPERLCVLCCLPLFLIEPELCRNCWRSDVDDFVEMMELGKIGLRLRIDGVTLPRQLR
jgi:hypothetical protein